MQKSFFFLMLFIPSVVFSQDKKNNKIEAAYLKGDYDQCVKLFDKYIKNEEGTFQPYYYASFSYFMKSENAADLKNFKSSLKYLNTAVKKDEENVMRGSAQILNIKKRLDAVADSLYRADKQKSKTYHNYLAKIFNDTTDAYREFYMPQSVRPDKEVVGLMEKGELNQTDAQGRKQGPWKKVYPNGNTAYEVYFKDNEPVGEFKRYHQNGKLQALLICKENSDLRRASLYDDQGYLFAKGFYKGQDKDSLWIYYSKDEKIIKQENYKSGKLNGEEKTFHPNGQLFDSKIWENGKESGLWLQFYDNGNKMLRAKMENGKREGLFLRFFKSGNIQAKGYYRNDLAEGQWEFYTREEGEKQTVEYIHGLPKDQENHDKKFSEYLQKMTEQKDKFVDPEKYRNNPEEFFRQSGGK